MRKTILFLLTLASPLLCRAAGLENGNYELGFRIADMGFSQVVTITNCSDHRDVPYYKFDLLIQEKGSLKRFDDDRQVLKGIVYDDRFKFIIPYANVATLFGFYFEGPNQSTNGVFYGEGDVPFQGPSGSGQNKFHFQLKPIPSSPATAPTPQSAVPAASETHRDRLLILAAVGISIVFMLLRARRSRTNAPPAPPKP